MLASINYTRADLWSSGSIAFEIFGLENPFMVHTRGSKAMLDSSSYKDANIPRLPKEIPGAVRRLVRDILRRNPKNVSGF